MKSEVKYKIFLDMDGVICDWESQFKLYSGGVSVDDYESVYGKDRRYFFIKNNCPEYYANMPFMPDAKKLLQHLKNKNVQILSHAPDKMCARGKIKWLEKHKILYKNPILVSNASDKSSYATPFSILIDDNKLNVAQFMAAGGKAILHVDADSTIKQLDNLFMINESKHRIYNSILNPEFWQNKQLENDVLNKLLKIAYTFYSDSKLQVPIHDIYMLGSSTGYNWTPTSDIDLHIVIDTKKIGNDPNLVKNYIDQLKNNWNFKHNIHIGRHAVELYIQDIHEQNRSQSVYSLLKNKWIKFPTYSVPNIDVTLIKTKYRDFVNRIKNVIRTKNIKLMHQLVQRIHNMRESGLSQGGEYSTENLVYKLLRSTKYIDKLKNAILNTTDKYLSK